MYSPGAPIVTGEASGMYAPLPLDGTESVGAPSGAYQILPPGALATPPQSNGVSSVHDLPADEAIVPATYGAVDVSAYNRM